MRAVSGRDPPHAGRRDQRVAGASFFPEEDALGRHMTVSFPRGPVTREFVGVVAYVRHAGTRAVAERIWTLAPTLPLHSTVTLGGQRHASRRGRRFSLLLLGLFAGTALGLAALGVCGLLNGATIEQVREIGVRLA